MDQFIGLRVHLDLLDGAKMEGLIRSVNEVSQILVLAEVVCENGGTVTQFPGFLEVFGADIVDVRVVADAPAPRLPPRLEARPASGAPGRASPKKPREAWAEEEVRQIKSQDFDFASSNRLFDKSRVFSEIRGQDTTDTAERLVAHNLSARGREKMRHTEHVLGQYGEDEEQEERIVNARSPLYTAAKERLLLRTANSQVIDPQCDGAHWLASEFAPILVENAGASLAAFLRAEHAGAPVRFLVGAHPMLDAVAFCAARCLILAGVRAAVEGKLQHASGPALAYRAYHDEVLKPAPVTSGAAVVVSTGSRPDGPFARLVMLDAVPADSAATVLVLGLGGLPDVAEYIHRSHPHAQLHLLATGHPETLPLFVGPSIRLLPYVR